MSATNEDADIGSSSPEPNGYIEMAQYGAADSNKPRSVTLSVSNNSPSPAPLSDGETLPLKSKHPKYYIYRKKALEAIIFIGGIAILWTLLALDIVAYHIPPGDDEVS